MLWLIWPARPALLRSSCAKNTAGGVRSEVREHLEPITLCASDVMVETTRMSSSDEIDLDPKLSGALAAPAPDAAKAVAGTSEVPASDALEGIDIAEALSSGRVDAITAQQLLIDQVLAEQFPPDLAPEQLERLRGELASLLVDDPTLAGLLRPL